MLGHSSGGRLGPAQTSRIFSGADAAARRVRMVPWRVGTKPATTPAACGHEVLVLKQADGSQWMGGDVRALAELQPWLDELRAAMQRSR